MPDAVKKIRYSDSHRFLYTETRKGTEFTEFLIIN